MASSQDKKSRSDTNRSGQRQQDNNSRQQSGTNASRGSLNVYDQQQHQQRRSSGGDSYHSYNDGPYSKLPSVKSHNSSQGGGNFIRHPETPTFIT